MHSYLVITLNLPLACTGYILARILPYCHLFSGSVVNHWIKYLCLLLYWATQISPLGLKKFFPSSGNVPSDSPQLSALRIVPGQRTWSLSRGKSASNCWLIWGYKELTITPPHPHHDSGLLWKASQLQSPPGVGWALCCDWNVSIFSLRPSSLCLILLSSLSPWVSIPWVLTNKFPES